ncbi:hypothetical protein IWQ56_005972 [Coemansia nantahalensis]|uniref:Uncharacterized protein n=2 Tax=Coemansia TaxID=4863 RepID=A0ACC1K876_9FUNG|nr:hypothetical protein IWQ56_005972 [Coemansia nantahalensis]KAJ2775109.1 hypothetical protein IWQ57_000534 [Coemansia nantahalensis]
MADLLAKSVMAVTMATVTVRSTLSYYVKGPRCPSWPLWFQVRRDTIHRAIRTAPKAALTDDAIDEIDFAQMDEERRRWDLPESTLPAEIGAHRRGAIRVGDVAIDAAAAFAGTGPAESGLLALDAADRAAGGQREIPYEIIAPDALRRTADSSGCSAERLFDCAPLAAGERVILYLHGGAYKMGSAASHRALVGRIAAHAGLRSVSIEYRLAPLHPFPAQLHDAYISFQHLVARGFAPGDIVVAGDSAGGNLALVLALLLRHTGVGVRGLLLLSPWADLITERASLKRNARFDFLTAPPLASPLSPARTFYAPGRRLDEGMRREMAHPLVSPVYADFAGFPPTLIQAGEKEVIIDEIAQLHHNIAAANPGADPARHVYECVPDMVHVFHQFLSLPDARRAIARAGEFIASL